MKNYEALSKSEAITISYSTEIDSEDLKEIIQSVLPLDVDLGEQTVRLDINGHDIEIEAEVGDFPMSDWFMTARRCVHVEDYSLDTQVSVTLARFMSGWLKQTGNTCADFLACVEHLIKEKERAEFVTEMHVEMEARMRAAHLAGVKEGRESAIRELTEKIAS